MLVRIVFEIGFGIFNADLAINTAYCREYWHIICHFKFTSQFSLTDTLSARSIFIFLVPNVTSPAMILNYFPDNALSDGPKNSRISVKSMSM